MESGTSITGFNQILVIPSAVTIFVILALLPLSKFRKLLLRNKLISSFVLLLFLLNCLEALTYSNIIDDINILIRFIYAIAILAATLFLSISGHLNPKTIIPKKHFYSVLVILCLFLVIAVTSTDWIVVGAKRNSYSISRVPGDYYWVLQAYTLFCVVFAPLLIFTSILKSDNPLTRKRNKVILISFIPIALSVTLVIILMLMGFNVTLFIIFPLATLLFLMTYLYTENKNDLFRLLVNVPFSQERKAYKEINERVMNYISMTQTDERISLKEFVSEIEKTFIDNALEIKDGNHNLAAELLSISLSTVYRNKHRKDENK